MSDRPRRTAKRERTPSPSKERSVNYKGKWALFNKGNPHAFRTKTASLARPALGDIETSINRSLSGTENAQNNAVVTLIYDPAPEPELDPNSGSEDDPESDKFKYTILQKYYNILFPGYNINEDRRYFRTYAKKYNAFFGKMHPEELVFYFYSDFDPTISGSEPMFMDTLGNKGGYSELPRYSNGCPRLAPTPDTEPYYTVGVKEDNLTDGCHYHIVSVKYSPSPLTIGESNYKVKMGGLNKHTNRPYFYIQYPVGGVLQNFYGDFFPYPPSAETGFGKKQMVIKKNDPKFFTKVNNLSKKQIGKSGKFVNYKGKKTPVESWCREYGRSFYDRECKQDLKDAGITVFNGFGKKVITRLRKTVGGSKRISSTRKSPEESATLFAIGTMRVGNDGNKWTIKKASNGIQRWIRSTSFGKKHKNKKINDSELKYLRSLK